MPTVITRFGGLVIVLFTLLLVLPSEPAGQIARRIGGPQMGLFAPKSYSNSFKRTGDSIISCSHTFQFQIAAPAGEKIVLAKLVTMADGNYLAAGSEIKADGNKEGLLLKISADGNIIQQTRMSLAGRPTDISDCKILIDGHILIAGILSDQIPRVFFAQLNEDFSAVFARTIQKDSLPAKVTLDVFDAYFVALGIQYPGKINYSTYDQNGNLIWAKNLAPDGLNDLIGFSGAEISNRTMCLSVNVNIAGKKKIEVINVSKFDGNILSADMLDDGNAENAGLAMNTFNTRVNLVGIIKTKNGDYRGFRSDIARSALTETYHDYQGELPFTFTTSAALDIAGDALGYFNSETGTLVFIKHFSASQTQVSFSEAYNLAGASSIRGVTRAFDGGYIFGLDSRDSANIIILKTDSTGRLPGCGSRRITIKAQEKDNVLNSSISITPTDAGNVINNETISISPSALISNFLCKQTTLCPSPTATDSCLTSYYKTLKFSGYVDFINKHFLLRNNNQLIFTSEYERIIGEVTQIKYSLKLLDEGGREIKATTILSGNKSVPFDAFQVDDHQVMLVFNASNGLQAFNFTLINDDLEKVWSKTIYTNNEFNAQGLGVSDVHEDAEGNFYFVSTELGFSSKPRLFIYKTDAYGNAVWARAFETDYGSFYQANVTSSPSGLIVVINGSNITSLLLNKNTGDKIGGYSFESNWDGSTNQRFMKYDKGRVFYAGTDKKNQLLLATFDALGSPLITRHLNLPVSIFSAADVRNGNLIVIFPGSGGQSEILLKADTGLNILFMNQYLITNNRQVKNIAINPEGYLYSAGNSIYENYSDPYLIKYDQQAKVGTCDVLPVSFQFTDEIPQPVAVSMHALDRVYPPTAFDVTLVPDKQPLNINITLCSSVATCTFISLNKLPDICDQQKDYKIGYLKNTGCTLEPQFDFDTSIATLKNITEGSLSFHFKKAGDFFLKARLNTSCHLFTDSVHIKVISAASTLNLGNDTTVCTGQSIILRAGSDFSNYLWQDGSVDSTFRVFHPGLYYVKVSNSCGDFYTDSVRVREAIAPENFLARTDSLCAHENKQISSSGVFSSYQWSDGNKTRSDIISKPGLYTLTVTDKNGCSATDTVTIVQKDCLQYVFFPNVFTPNSDHLNDVFHALVYAPPAEFSLRIYNRYGQEIFTTHDVKSGWDGTYKGIPCEAGNYVWLCFYKYEGGKIQQRSGSIMLVR